MQNVKDTNPKDAIGSSKFPLTVVPFPVIAEVGLGMLEGGGKYGAHNYRVAGVRASVYVDAALRHIMRYWEGEDIDPEAGGSPEVAEQVKLHHITKAIASLVVLRDAQMNGMVNDDRPPSVAEWASDFNARAAALVASFTDPKPRYTQVGLNAGEYTKVGQFPQHAQDYRHDPAMTPAEVLDLMALDFPEDAGGGQ